MRQLAALVAGALALSACAQTVKPDRHAVYNGGGAGTTATGGSSSGGTTGSGGTANGGNAGASAGGSGGTASGGSAGTATGGSGGSAGTSAGGSGGTASGGSAGSGNMDPALALPDPNGTPCTHPGSSSGCASLEVCRISGPDSGRCESCDGCGNLGAFCTTNRDCDILFQCYQGTCTNICPLGTSYCGAVADCLNVGNNTYGVCKP